MARLLDLGTTDLFRRGYRCSLTPVEEIRDGKGFLIAVWSRISEHINTWGTNFPSRHRTLALVTVAWGGVLLGLMTIQPVSRLVLYRPVIR